MEAQDLSLRAGLRRLPPCCAPDPASPAVRRPVCGLAVALRGGRGAHSAAGADHLVHRGGAQARHHRGRAPGRVLALSCARSNLHALSCSPSASGLHPICGHACQPLPGFLLRVFLPLESVSQAGYQRRCRTTTSPATLSTRRSWTGRRPRSWPRSAPTCASSCRCAPGQSVQCAPLQCTLACRLSSESGMARGHRSDGTLTPVRRHTGPARLPALGHAAGVLQRLPGAAEGLLSACCHPGAPSQ